MKVKSKVVARYEDKGRLKAVATVCLDGKFLVTGVRVADCQKGLAVFMPSREIHAGEYRDICFMEKGLRCSGRSPMATAATRRTTPSRAHWSRRRRN